MARIPHLGIVLYKWIEYFFAVSTDKHIDRTWKQTLAIYTTHESFSCTPERRSLHDS
jgi:hypothetical protein